MKRNVQRVLLGVTAALFVFCAVLVMKQVRNYRAADQIYKEAASVAQSVGFAVSPEPTSTPAPTPEPTFGAKPLEEDAQFLLKTDLDALREINEDVLGWIWLPGSAIDYPLMKVADNEEYLRRAWDGSANSAGCIFLECRNQHDFGDFNTLIYGHFMRNGTMFGSLLNYQEQEYADSHPHIYIVTDDFVRRYEVFSAYEADVVSDTYRLYFEDDAHRQSVVDSYAECSVVKFSATPTGEDRVLTLSTCMGTGTYDTRWVVQAVLTGEFSRTAE